jgi:hypothetical protein
MPDQKSETIANIFMAGFVCRHGVPRALISDRGQNLLSQGMQELYRACNIRKLDTTAYTPQTNGLVENMNRIIQDHLAMLVDDNQRDWDDQLPYALFAIRTAKQATTGETAYYMLYGQDPYLPMDQALEYRHSPYVTLDEQPYPEQLQARLGIAWRQVQDRVDRAHAAQKKQHDKSSTTVTMKPGDLVLLRRMVKPKATIAAGEIKGSAQPLVPLRALKLAPRYSAPYVIKEVRGPTFLVVPQSFPDATPIRIHQRNTKPFKAAPPTPPDPTNQPTDPDIKPTLTPDPPKTVIPFDPIVPPIIQNPMQGLEEEEDE